MINDSICCPNEADTFLAKTSVKPFGIERPRRTQKEIRATQEELEAVLDQQISPEELNAFWEVNKERQQLETQKSFLLEQQRKLEGKREGR